MTTMEHNQDGTSPQIITSKRKIVYRNSLWNLHQFQVWSGEQIGSVMVLKMAGSLLLWLGRTDLQRLGEVALGMPAKQPTGETLSTTLLDGDSSVTATALALRLAAGLRQPVFVCCALSLDRFNALLLERALAAEIRLVK